jgi:CheY-like chemotaxis protein
MPPLLPSGPKPLVLVVDDEAAVRRMLQAALPRLGFDVLAAAGGAEAVDLYRGRRADIAVVLLDVKMPGLDGPATLAQLRGSDPGVCCVFMTGHAAQYAVGHLGALGAGLLFKPFALPELASALRAALGGRAGVGHQGSAGSAC